MAKVKFPEGCTSVSWGGATFDANKKGVAEVPEESVADLAAHGVVPVEDPAPVAPTE